MARGTNQKVMAYVDTLMFLNRNKRVTYRLLSLLTGELGILVAGGCDDSCHNHLDDTLFFSFATETWETLPAKVGIGG